jgi:Asp-tRNA(Asn)/Glu-tRNA(Gln) amidotransferase A subunit family amidase
MLHTLSLTAAADQIHDGSLRSVDLVRACLDRVERVDSDIDAWALVDAERALERAAECDAEVGSRELGPLHGVPIGVKDIIETAGLQTEAGSEFLRGHIPDRDAFVVSRLRKAGAIILGKTVTTEFACFDPATTSNPWNPEHTPGGSSSGTAAATAARMIPAAIGSQTGGSISRPAAYCGVVGFKPTYGRISLRGVYQVSYSLDHLGSFARSVDDAALLARTMTAHDPKDPFSICRDDAFTRGEEATRAEPRLGVAQAFFFDAADPEVTQATSDLTSQLSASGASVLTVPLPKSFKDVHQMHRLIMYAEAAAYHETRFSRKPGTFRPGIRSLIEEGLLLPAVAYAEARRHQAVFQNEMRSSFRDIDVLITPATPTTAPRGLHSTGDPTFNVPWSYSGYPTVVLPVGLSRDGLPIAIQLIAQPFDEARLLDVSRWVEHQIGFDTAPTL